MLGGRGKKPVSATRESPVVSILIYISQTRMRTGAARHPLRAGGDSDRRAGAGRARRRAGGQKWLMSRPKAQDLNHIMGMSRLLRIDTLLRESPGERAREGGWAEERVRRCERKGERAGKESAAVALAWVF